MKSTFKDHFSENSRGYGDFRPQYPHDLFSFLASIVVNHQKAWDCATGTGQSAIDLSGYFSEVVATDASKSQIDNAIRKNGIVYHVGTAEKSGIESNSIDLITVAQALHWFDIESFSKEVNRVLRKSGIVAVWTYNLLSVQQEIDEIIYRLYNTVLGEFWPRERKLVENGYKDVQLPFTELTAPRFNMKEEWNFSQLIGYLSTWSAVKNYRGKHGKDPIEKVQMEISKIWGEPEQTLMINWPLSIKLWQKIT